MPNAYKWEDSDSLLWIDGNTATTGISIPEGHSRDYNVDRPDFWPPMSVISGLASGFCERKAVLNPTFSGVIWSDQTSAAIVSRCVQGLALGSKGDALFNAANDATFHYPITGATNYMTAMDAAITTLVSGTTYFVTAAGQQYRASNDVFSGLAVAARTRAGNTAGSSIALPTSDGWNYSEEMLPAYPVAWAKERKWMLDELRYVGTGMVTIDPINIIGNVYEYSASSTLPGGNKSTDVNVYYNVYLAGATQSTQDKIWGGVSGTSDAAPTASVFMRVESADISTATNPAYISGWETSAYLANGSRAVLTRPSDGLYMTRLDTAAQTGTVKVDLVQAPPLSNANTTPICVHDGETSHFTSATNDPVYVFSGGTAIFEDNRTNLNGYHAIIFSGGYASAEAVGGNGVNKTARFNDLCILTGGTFTGPRAANILHIKGFYADPNCSPNTSDIYVIDGVSSTLDSNAVNSAFFLVNGGTLSVPPGGAAGVVYVGSGCTLSAGSSAVNGHTAQSAGDAKARITYLTIDSGGYAYLGHATRDISRTTVLQGATLYADVYQDKLTFDAYFDSGCTATINYLTGTDPGTMPFTQNAQVTMGYGGMADMVNAAATTTYPKITINAYRSTDDVNNALARSVDLHVFDPMGLHSSGGPLVTEGLNTLPAVFAQGSTAACVITAEGSTAATNLLQQPPISNTATYRLIGTDGYYVHYNCAIGAVYAEPYGTGVTNHYLDFRVRQWATDPA